MFRSIKTIFIILAAVVIMVSCNSNKNEYSITGTIDGTEGETMYLSAYLDGELLKIDSSTIKEGRFSFHGNVDVPELLYLSLNGNKNSFTFFPDKGELTITAYADSLASSEIVGSSAQTTYNDYKKSMRIYEQEMENLSRRYSEAKASGEEDRLKNVDAEADALYEKMQGQKWMAFSQNTSGFLGPYLLYSELYYDLDDIKLDSTINLIDTAVQSKSHYVKMLKNQVDVLRRVAIGAPAPNFEMADSSGNSMSLNDLKGKYTYLLIDFWASWCNPCRQENPNVVAIYNDYKTKGFEVLGVSFDKDKSPWVKAIKTDNLTWYHVSDLKGWQNAAGKIYGIRSIPSNVLLDRNGIIIAKNLRGDDLRNKLVNLLGK